MSTNRRFGDALRISEFRTMWFAEMFSMAGDQLARVALALLVFEHTNSAALTALTYALTFLPAVLSGTLLSGLADYLPRRRILIITDAMRTVIAGAMAIPGLPLSVLWTLVCVLSASGGPYKAAQQALLPQVLGELYPTGLALRQVTTQLAQLVGFAGGGLLLSAVEPHIALAFNAATFMISMLLVRSGVRARPVPARRAPAIETGDPAGFRATERLLWPLFALTAILGFSVVPEGLAAPYAAGMDATSLSTGLLMAADPVGSAIGAWLAARWRRPPSPRSVVALAAGSGLPLIACVFRPGLVLSLGLWALTGALATLLLIQLQTMMVDRVQDQRRGKMLGRLATCLYAGVGIAVLCGGIAAQAIGPYYAVAAAGLLSVLLAAAVGTRWPPDPPTKPTPETRASELA
jgi:MFS family permease